MNPKANSPLLYKTRLYGQFARLGRALANPHRLEILDLLSQGERTVEDLAHEVGTTVSNISQHLQVLRQSGLVTSRKEGLYVHYSLSGDDVVTLWQSLRRVAVALSSDLRELVARFVDERDHLEPVPQEELLERARAGRVVVLDVRPAREYNAGHIPDAISIPLDQLPNRIGELPRDREIVAYCRGPYCLLSIEAVEQLRAAGLAARRLEDGFPEWRGAGLPVQRRGDQS